MGDTSPQTLLVRCALNFKSRTLKSFITSVVKTPLTTQNLQLGVAWFNSQIFITDYILQAFPRTIFFSTRTLKLSTNNGKNM